MTFATLALVCLVAIAGPLLALDRWLHLPVVIGELVVGLALGATGLGVVHAGDPTFTFMADIGFALVMLVAGTHVPLREKALRQGAVAGLARAAGIGLLAVPAGLLLAHLFGTGHGPLYAVLIASSSASLVMPALSGMPLTGPPIIALLPQLAIADAACIVALPLALDPAHVARSALGAALVIAAGVVAFLVLRWAERSGRRREVHDVSEDHGFAIELRLLLAVLFGLAALAQAMHVSIMLAGFVTGLAVAGVGEPRRVAKQVFALSEGFFAPLFFVWLGASLDLRQLVAHPGAIGLGLALGLTAVVLHGLGALTRQPWPVAVVTSAQLGVPVAAATLGTHAGILHPGESAALLLGALVTIAATAVVSGRVGAVARSSAPAQDVAQGGALSRPADSGRTGTGAVRP